MYELVLKPHLASARYTLLDVDKEKVSLYYTHMQVLCVVVVEPLAMSTTKWMADRSHFS